jgi:hypothetical protein
MPLMEICGSQAFWLGLATGIAIGVGAVWGTLAGVNATLRRRLGP